LSLGISDHAAGPELVPLLERWQAMSSQLALAVSIGFSREMQDAYDAGKLDAVIVRQEGSRRGGEKLAEDEFGWFATKRFAWHRGESLPLATLAPPCGVRAIAVRALDKAGIAWSETFVGGGVTAVVAAADRAGRAGRHRAGARPAAAWRLKGDTALEGQRSRQTRGAADAGGDVPERGRRGVTEQRTANYFASVGAIRIFHRFQMRSSTARLTVSAFAPSSGVR
jgi:hypothetical protein